MDAAPAGAQTAPAISVVIPTLGSHETLRRVLEGFARQTVSASRFEIVLVVDAGESHQEAVESAIASGPANIRPARGPRPGASANRNRGWQLARAPLILFTDNDTIPQPSLIEEHLLWHEQHRQDQAAVIGLVQWAPEIEVTPFMRWLDTGFQFDYANMAEGDVGWGRFTTANVSLKRRFIERVGGFDEERFPYGYEDTEWAYRASKLGFLLLYNPRAVVDHLRVMTLDFWKTRARRIAAAEFQFTQLYPEIRPWFHTKFTAAAKSPPARGRGVRLAPYVSPRVPWLGSKVWRSVDLKYRQELATPFLEAWDEIASTGTGTLSGTGQPDLSEWS
jgi:GT2 family glycosyltransferase